MNSTPVFPPKPLGGKCYGSIGHLPGSRRGPGDHGLNEGQARICTTRVRDRRDRVIVTEKLDGSNVGVAMINGVMIPLIRAGYPAISSKYEQHRLFASWVFEQEARFRAVLQEGERLCGEWLALAHGTRYALPHEPFVVFDLMRGPERATFDDLRRRIEPQGFILPRLLSDGPAFPIEAARAMIDEGSGHGAIDPVEGAVWRVELRGKANSVDFLAKWVRPGKEDGCYLTEVSGRDAVWNWRPGDTAHVGTGGGNGRPPIVQG